MALKSAVTTDKYLDLNPYDKNLNVSLEDVRRTLAKRANQRILRLDRAISPITGESYGSYGAVDQVRHYLRIRKQKRFSESATVKMTQSALKSEILVLQDFLKAKSSTVVGQKEIEKRRIEAFESGKWGDFKWTGTEHRKIKFARNKDFWDFLNSGILEEFKRLGFTSEQAIEAYDMLREKNGEEEALMVMKQMVDEYRGRKSKISIDELYARMGEGLLNKERSDNRKAEEGLK